MLGRPGRQEGAFEKGSQPVHGNIQNGMEVIFKHVKKNKHKRSYLGKVSLHAMYASTGYQDYVCLDRHGGAC
jgi:hypothetical protein